MENKLLNIREIRDKIDQALIENTNKKAILDKTREKVNQEQEKGYLLE